MIASLPIKNKLYTNEKPVDKKYNLISIDHYKA